MRPFYNVCPQLPPRRRDSRGAHEPPLHAYTNCTLHNKTLEQLIFIAPPWFGAKTADWKMRLLSRSCSISVCVKRVRGLNTYTRRRCCIFQHSMRQGIYRAVDSSLCVCIDDLSWPLKRHKLSLKSHQRPTVHTHSFIYYPFSRTRIVSMIYSREFFLI